MFFNITILKFSILKNIFPVASCCPALFEKRLRKQTQCCAGFSRKLRTIANLFATTASYGNVCKQPDAKLVLSLYKTVDTEER